MSCLFAMPVPELASMDIGLSKTDGSCITHTHMRAYSNRGCIALFLCRRFRTIVTDGNLVPDADVRCWRAIPSASG